MSDATQLVVRAWKDPAYKDSLPEDVRKEIPPRPDDYDTLSDDQLEQAAGGTTPTAAIAGVAGAIGAAGLIVSTIDDATDDPNGPG